VAIAAEHNGAREGTLGDKTPNGALAEPSAHPEGLRWLDQAGLCRLGHKVHRSVNWRGAKTLTGPREPRRTLKPSRAASLRVRGSLPRSLVLRLAAERGKAYARPLGVAHAKGAPVLARDYNPEAGENMTRTLSKMRDRSVFSQI
jgi:hypothetical protein